MCAFDGASARVCEWKVVWCNGTTCGLGSSWWLQSTRLDAQRPVQQRATISVIARTVCIYIFRCVWQCLRVCECVSLSSVTYWERQLESGVSLSDVGFWCFPNQRSGTSSDEDVMSSSGFISHSNCGTAPHATLLSLSFCQCLYFRLSCLRTVSVSLSLSLPRCTVGE